MDVSGMKAEDMRLSLQQMHDFKYEKTILESLLATNGHKGFFIPKFHCELNPIERVWGKVRNVCVHIVTILSRVLRVPSFLHLIV